MAARNKTVDEVLSEAAEHLCKLGHSLRLRSEKLRNKRLSNAKLKNSHSVKKAANKMLLICNLSKDSIRNVEESVVKVLDVCSNKLQERDSDTSASTSNRAKRTKFKDYCIGSKTIKVPRNIELNDFECCKVNVDSMTMEELDKYPVHCNSKLFRYRQKKQQERRNKYQSHSDKDESDDSQVININKHKKSSHKKSESSVEIQSASDISENDGHSHIKKQRKRSESSVENQTNDSDKNKSEDSDSESRHTKKKQKNSGKKSESSVEIQSASDISENDGHSHTKKQRRRSESSGENQTNDSDKNKSEDSDSESRHTKKKHKNSGKKSEGSVDTQSASDISENDGHSHTKKQRRRSESSGENQTNDSDKNKSEDSDSESRHTKKKHKNSGKKSEGSVDIQSTSDISENDGHSHTKEQRKRSESSGENQTNDSDKNKSEDSDSKSRHTKKKHKNSGKKSESSVEIQSASDISENDDHSHTKKQRRRSESSVENQTNDSDKNKSEDSDSKNRHTKKKHKNSGKKSESSVEIQSASDISENDGHSHTKKQRRRSESSGENQTNDSDKNKSEDSDSESRHTKKKHKKSGKKSEGSVDIQSASDISKNDGHSHTKTQRKQSESSVENQTNDSDQNKSEDSDSKSRHTKNKSSCEKNDSDKEISEDDAHCNTKNLRKRSESSLKNQSSDERNDSDSNMSHSKFESTGSDIPQSLTEAPSRMSKCNDNETATRKTDEEAPKTQGKQAISNNVDMEAKKSSSENSKKRLHSKRPKSSENKKRFRHIRLSSDSSDEMEKDVSTSDIDNEINTSDKVKDPPGNKACNAEYEKNKEGHEKNIARTHSPEKSSKNLEFNEHAHSPHVSRELDENFKLNLESMKVKEITDLKVLMTTIEINEELLKTYNIIAVKKDGKIMYPINKYNKNKLHEEIRNSSENEESIQDVEREVLHDSTSSDNETMSQKKVAHKNQSDFECQSDDEVTTSREKISQKDDIKNTSIDKSLAIREVINALLNSDDEESLDGSKNDVDHKQTINQSLLRDSDEEPCVQSNLIPEPGSSCQAKNIESISSETEISENEFNEAIRVLNEVLKKTSETKEELKTDTSSESNVSKSKRKIHSSSSDSSTTSSSNESQRPKKKKKKMRRSNKASGSREPSTDTSDTHQDKVIDGLANLKSLIKKRRSKRSRVDETNVSKKNIEMSNKVQDILNADSSSSDESDANSIASEELPTVNVNELNGGDHLAKEDLLDDSDSSNSSDKVSEASSEHKETVSDSGTKSKRRKGNAISSDSEGGSSRKKKLDSDFEDSEEEGSESTNGKNKRKKKKPIISDDSNSDDESGKTKRKRIKPLNDSEGSGSDSENEGKKHGRKNIRRVMGKDQLEEATKKAAREEKERMARISERQKLYNNLAFDESGKPDEIVLDKVVLDFDPDTKEPLIQVDRGLVKKLKPHQANGIKFMWDACFESVKRIKKDKGSGCILAHCMGLGKTLQVVSLTHTLITHSELTGVNRILVVCPLSTVLNWVNEYRMWLEHAENTQEVDIYELSRYKQNSERAYQLQSWLDNGGICVLGYEMFRNLSADNSKKFRKKMLKSFQESLVDPGPDLVVCDEGHLLKNEKTSLSQSMNRVKTLRRIVLTGTPLQNNLKEYYCMVQFVKPNLLGKFNEYLNRFVNPITNGQYTDSTEHDIKVMKRRSHVLHKMLDGAVQRRDYGVLAPFLPPKHEYVLFITLTDIQAKLYQHYLENYSRRPLAGKSSGFLFPDFQSLQRIWTHPLVLKYNSARYEIMQQKKREREEEEDSEGSLADFIDDESTSEDSTSEDESDSMSDMSDDSRKKSKKKSNKKSKGKESKAGARRGTRANPNELLDEDNKLVELEEVKNDNPTEWWIPLVTDDELEDLRNSHKLVLLFDILRQCEAIGDKLLVFSQSLYSLDLIEHFLKKIDEATQDGRVEEKLGKHVGSWSPGVDYFRLDGSSNCENRSIWCKNFNREDNPRARLFLISTRAGGLGINLVAANRVIIFDVSWNPSHDVQSIFRVYRFGQKKPCYIYRFLAMGTMEEKIYERQVTKQAISKRVIDEQQIDRHYAENDLSELYRFEPVPAEPRSLPPLPKDRLFAEMLREYEKQIYKYHEHDSLLENKEEETLTEEERKAAWEDFENEKTRPPPPTFGTQWNMQGLLQQQQQQQFAMNAVVTMLRKDYPNMTEQQLSSMLPLIYNANPGLMQKMSEIYKFANPAMMGQGMLNPAAPLGSTSALQYEPPWQRQQQQLRLQQMIQQQQQSINAKYYAGGLGSRDPVAMALQQQRAREMLVGDRIDRSETRGRPRGRPPLNRPPPVTTDIVDLDSD